MIIYVEINNKTNLNIKQFRKVTGYKINMLKSMDIGFNTSNSQLEDNGRETPFTIATRKI